MLEVQPVHRSCALDLFIKHGEATVPATAMVGPAPAPDPRAPRCRIRPQGRPFDPDGAMYQTGPKRRVCRRVLRERGHPARATGTDQAARFGDRTTNGHDVQANHRGGWE